MTDQEKLQKLTDKIRGLRTQTENLTNKIARERDAPQLKKLKGTFQKYRNNFSCPETEKDYWWIYRFVYEVTDSGTVKWWEFQTDKNLEFSFKYSEKKCLHHFSFFQDKWQPCTKREFETAIKKVNHAIFKAMGLAKISS